MGRDSDHGRNNLEESDHENTPNYLIYILGVGIGPASKVISIIML